MPAPDSDGPRTCPICAAALGAVEKEAIVADACPEHGLFLDHGELEVLERGAQKGARLGIYKATARARRRAYQDGRDECSLLSLLFDDSRSRRDTRRIKRKKIVDQYTAPKVEHDNDSLVPEGERPCPVCGQTMQAERRKDVWGRTATIVIDLCPTHGIWLDDSELEILLDRANQTAKRAGWARRRRATKEAYERGRRDAQNDAGFDKLDFDIV